MLNCLIVDDEPLARRQVEAYVSQVPFLKLVGAARNALAAKGILETEPVDLIFLDIQMPQITGVEFLKQNDIFQQVIFITAYPEYALDGFDLEVTDYLVKPVSFERFLKACNKAVARVSGSQTIKSVSNQPGFLYVKCSKRFEKIWIKDILYIEAMLNYVNIIAAQRKYTVYSSLKAIENNLPPNDFVRIHKSYMAAKKHISAVDAHEVQIAGRRLPLSRANRQAVLQELVGRIE